MLAVTLVGLVVVFFFAVGVATSTEETHMRRVAQQIAQRHF